MTADPENCAHCAINKALDAFNAAHSPMNIETLVDDLSACMCELIASHPDTKDRNAFAKKTADIIRQRVRLFRETGRYPGGPCGLFGHGPGLH
jgi:hypothetical protein